METENKKQAIKEIMLVDDDPINNLITSKYVQKAGLKSITFDNPLLALDYLKKVPEIKPDIILLDINMPFMDGFEFLTAMEKENLAYNVIILTSSINMKDRNRATEFKSVIDYWVKPLSFTKILNFNLQPEHH